MDQPPRYTRRPDPPGDEPSRRFASGYPGEPRLPARRGGGGFGGPAQANPWLVGLAVAVVLAAISVIAFGFFAPDDQTAASTTTSSTLDTTSSTDGGSTTSVADGSTTTGDSTSTTVPDGTLPTVTVPDGEIPPIVPIGDAIPITELELTTDDIGPLDFGGDGDQVLGRLAATFGDPTQDTGFMVGSGSWGECAGEAVRVVQWGPLNVVLIGEYGNSEFVSYRLDLRYGGITSPTTDIETRSGLRVGDQVSQLKDIYTGYSIEFVVDADAGLVFELRAQLGGDLLLWGPVESQDDEALVTGIYSPDSCGRT